MTIYCQDKEMVFGKEKCVMAIMRSGKRYMTEGTEESNQEKSECSEKNKLKHTWEH